MRQIETFFDNLFLTLATVLMSFIKRLARFVVPIPPAWYWGKVIAASSGSLLVGISAAVVLEFGGMLSAHYAVTYWGTGKGKLAATLNGLYLLIGIGVMWLMDGAGSDEKIVITAVFIIAGMVYVLSGLAVSESQELAQMAEAHDFERNEQAKDNDLERELKRQKQADNTAVRLAKLQANGARQVARSRHDERHDVGNLPADWRQLSQQQIHDLAHATREDREALFPDLASRTVRQWHYRLDQVASKNGTGGG